MTRAQGRTSRMPDHHCPNGLEHAHDGPRTYPTPTAQHPGCGHLSKDFIHATTQHFSR